MTEPTLNELTARLAALEAENGALAELLSIISSSPNDIIPVLNAINFAVRDLCEADAAVVSYREGDQYLVSELESRASASAVTSTSAPERSFTAKAMATGRAVNVCGPV